MEFSEHKPIYLQLADFILEGILIGKYKAGDRIPSVRDVALTAQVTPNTAMRAFQYLQDRGIIFNKRGLGYFVADNAFMYVRKIKLAEFEVHYLPDFFKQMELLQLSFEDIQKFYENFKNSKNEKENK